VRPAPRPVVPAQRRAGNGLVPAPQSCPDTPTALHAASEQTSGTVELLLVRDVGNGPGADPACAEVVVKLSSGPDRTLSFRVRKQPGPTAHRSMLDALYEAYLDRSPVVLEYDLEPVRSNGGATVVALTT
jgi:hypothetical protein